MLDADLLLRNFELLTMQAGSKPYGLIENGAVAVRNGMIDWVGPANDPGIEGFDGTIVEGNGEYLSPGLVDCHTHLVWGGSRADEWERRLNGVSYEEIARQGGGILSTVSATRAASEAELFTASRKRLEFLMRQGVTTLEIKSGYGLDVETEKKILQVATDLRDATPLDVQRTFLGAHALPADFRGRAEDYIDLVCGQMLQEVSGLCDSIDVFCEGIGFDLDQSRRVIEAGKAAGLQAKIHAEQLSNLGGAKMAAELGALSADHLEYLDASGVAAMAKHDTVAVLLPGAFYFIHETQLPPVELLRQHGVAIAIATDANPGSSPAASLLLMMNMACTLFRMTPEEALAAVTTNAAKALAMHDRVGQIAEGFQADFVSWQIGSPAELAYGIGHNPCQRVWKRGELIVDYGQ